MFETLCLCLCHHVMIAMSYLKEQWIMCGSSSKLDSVQAQLKLQSGFVFISLFLLSLPSSLCGMISCSLYLKLSTCIYFKMSNFIHEQAVVPKIDSCLYQSFYHNAINAKYKF